MRTNNTPEVKIRLQAVGNTVKMGLKDAGPQGPAGENGITPHIGENGNWFVGGIDTGVRAQGPTSYDAGKLGGQLPEYYAKQEDVNQLSEQKVDKTAALTLEEIKASTDLTGKLPSANAMKTLQADVNGLKTGLCYFLKQDGHTIPSQYGAVLRIMGNSWFGTYTGDSYYICIGSDSGMHWGKQENGATEPTWTKVG